MPKQNTKKINEWKAANITRINLEFRNDSHIIERINEAIDQGKAKSRQAYILDAVKKALEADGIPEITDSDK